MIVYRVDIVHCQPNRQIAATQGKLDVPFLIQGGFKFAFLFLKKIHILEEKEILQCFWLCSVIFTYKTAREVK